MIGFDRIRQYAQYFPPLTSIGTVSASVPETAVRLLLRRIANPDAPVHMAVLPVAVYEDGTTAPPATE